ncbi:hypothetical protein ACFUJ0_04200, partial [Streptomyces sp. NPDC057242]
SPAPSRAPPARRRSAAPPPRPGGGPRAGAVREAFGSWLSVRTLGGPAGTPGALPDPDGRLRADLDLAPGAWVLVRPDGYTASGGAELTGAALDRALAPLDRAAAPADARVPADARIPTEVGAPAGTDAPARVLEGHR